MDGGTVALPGHIDHRGAMLALKAGFLAMGPSLAMLATRKSPVVFVNIFMEGEVALAAAAEVLCPGSRRTNIM